MIAVPKINGFAVGVLFFNAPAQRIIAVFKGLRVFVRPHQLIGDIVVQPGFQLALKLADQVAHVIVFKAVVLKHP